jgi:hypothetical protein
MLFINLAFASDANAKRDFNSYDVSILLKASPLESFGNWPLLDFDFSQIKHVPIFNQSENTTGNKSVRGLVGPQTQQTLLEAFDELHLNAFLRFL